MTDLVTWGHSREGKPVLYLNKYGTCGVFAKAVLVFCNDFPAVFYFQTQ